MTCPDDFKVFNLRDFDRDSKKIESGIDKGIRVKGWNILEIKASSNELEGDNPHFFGYSETPLISESAKEALLKFEPNMEFLPVFDYETEKTYYLVNILKIIDAIDYERSIFRKLPSGLVVGLEKYAFKDTAKDEPIFKIYLNNRVKTTEVFVNDVFKESVETNNLKGFKFIEIFKFE